MRILVAHNWYYHNNNIVETYSRSMIRALRLRGHEVLETIKEPPSNKKMYEGVDLLLDIDCGRDSHGNLYWHGQEKKPPVPSAVYFIDSHGYPSLHKRVGVNYDHVFFCVWDKRDLFVKHPSAHWCPNFTDLTWFDGRAYPILNKLESFDFGFFGSKGGLSRAKPLIEIAAKNGWSCDVRQVSVSGKHRWPQTAEAMGQCRILFNHGQKHDGPNLRVMESMCMKRPLICDNDPRSGMDKLFIPGVHYVPYEAYTYVKLEEQMKWVMENQTVAQQLADDAYVEVLRKHLVGNRIDQILEVVT